MESYLEKYFHRQHFYNFSSTVFIRYLLECVVVKGNIGEEASLLEPCLQGDVQMSLLVLCLSDFPGGCASCWVLAVS